MSGNNGGEIRIEPGFNPQANQITFPSVQLNRLLSEVIIDNTSTYQRLYQEYGYMRLTNALKFKIYNMTMGGLTWQASKSCTITPMGVINMLSNEVTPCKAVALTEQCHDELYNSCFAAMNEWNGNGPVMLSPEGEMMLTKLVDTYLSGVIEGARATLTGGQLYDTATVTFKPETTSQEKADFAKANEVCQGWVQMLKVGAAQAGYSNWNYPGLICAADFDCNLNYTGDIVALLDELRTKAPDKLQRIVDEGGMSMSSEIGQPIYKLTSKLFAAFVQAFRSQNDSAFKVDPRITMERDGRVMLYFFDGIPVIPTHELNTFEQYIVGCTQLAVLTVSGNINLGASFADLPNQNNQSVGLMLWSDPDPKSFGNVVMRSDSLFATAIADRDLVSAAQIFTVPA